jgi:COMPASS component SWD3
MWDYLNSKPLRTFRGHKNNEFSVASGFGVSSDASSQFIFSGSEDGSIHLWDVHSKQSLQVLESHSKAVLAVDAQIGGDVLVSGGVDGDSTVKIWQNSGAAIH